VKILADANGSAISLNAGTGAWTAATLTAGGASPKITQAATAGSKVTIAVNTTIALGGTSAATLGSIVITGHDSNPAELAFADTATSVVTTGNTMAATPFVSAASIGTKTFAAGSSGKAAVYTINSNAAGTFAGLKGGTDGYGIKAGDASNTVAINSAATVA
jgi:hypothetical protein